MKWLSAVALGSIAAAAVIVACGFDGAGTRDISGADSGDETPAHVPGSDAATTDAMPLDGGDAGKPCVTDLSVDPLHCGRCGHSCFDGTCVGGACQPVTLATRSRPHDIALDATNVYWTDKGGGLLLPNVSTVPKIGGTTRYITQGALSSDPTGIVFVPPATVVFTDMANSLILSCDQAGTTCQNQQFINAEPEANGVTWSGTSIYWANSGTGTIRRADAMLQNDVSFAPTRNGSRRVVANAANVFWTMSNGIEVAPLSGTPISTYAGSGSPRDLAIDATYIYFVTATEVRRLTHGLQGDLLVGTGTDIQRVAVDASGIYFTDRGSGGRVLRCPLAGCIGPTQPDVLATGEASVLALALDASQVFWTNELSANGTVRRVAK